jgi:pyruvate/2-oxoglutarate dehydrogenase complex dihydrolipoamide dehydrogenase (E3) component
MGASVEVDVAVIGAGQAGPALSIALAQRGRRVVLVEGAQVGGTCVNNGCTPTKTLRKSARVAHMARRASEFGVQVGAVEVDFAAAMERMQERVEKARGGLEQWIGGTKNLTLMRGWASFTRRSGNGFDLTVGEQAVHAKRVYLNTGTRAFIPPIAGLADVPHLDNVSLLKLRERPSHLVVIGGSYIGLEMGQIFRRLGSRVTVIETGPRITAREDEDVSACIAAFLREEGIAVHAGQPVTHAERTAGGDVALTVGDQRIEGSHVLVATGRLPNTERLNLEAVDVETDERGFIPTNGRLETSVPGVWALGDINKRGAFTHTSYHDHEIALANFGREPHSDAPGGRSADDRTMAYAMFTDPPFGRVGLSEAEARKAGKPMLMATFDMKNVSRAKEESETTGLVKLIVDAQTDRFVGASIIGTNADEIVQVFSNFMAAGGTVRQMKEALPIHPTVTEYMPTILGKLKPLV